GPKGPEHLDRASSDQHDGIRHSGSLLSGLGRSYARSGGRRHRLGRWTHSETHRRESASTQTRFHHTHSSRSHGWARKNSRSVSKEYPPHRLEKLSASASQSS